MNVLLGLFFVVFFISTLFPTFFPCWVYMRLAIIALGMLFLGMGLFHNMKKIINTLKRFGFRCLSIIMGITLIMFSFLDAVSGVRDIGPYLTKKYVKISGTPNTISSMGRKWREQTIKINQMELINTHDIAWEDQNKELEFTYLPRSKYVISIKVIE